MTQISCGFITSIRITPELPTARRAPLPHAVPAWPRPPRLPAAWNICSQQRAQSSKKVLHGSGLIRLAHRGSLVAATSDGSKSSSKPDENVPVVRLDLRRKAARKLETRLSHEPPRAESSLSRARSKRATPKTPSGYGASARVGRASRPASRPASPSNQPQWAAGHAGPSGKAAQAHSVSCVGPAH